MKKILLAIAVLLLVTCSEDGPKKSNSNLIQDFDRGGEVINLTVHWYSTQGQVDKVFVEHFGTTNPGREGFAVWVKNDTAPYRCEIHTLRPKNVDDNKMNVLGHELSHCVLGTFHVE